MFKKLTTGLTNKRESSDSESDDSFDSDEELQNAFESGKLKSGFVAETVAKQPNIKNTVGLQEKLEEIRTELDWVERLDLINDASQFPALLKDGDVSEEKEIIDNDFKREMKFYRQAQAAVLEGIPRLKSLGLKTKRPEDYFAEMAKSDDHMKKIREVLLRKQLGMERSEKAKKMRDLQKYGKKVQKEVLQNRQKGKREMLEAVKKYRKGQIDKLDLLNDDFEDNERKQNKKSGQKDKRNMPNKKRIYKNAKFGFGGQKKRSKMNTRESLDDFSKYGSNFLKGASRKKGGMKNKRPGKSVRQKIKSKR